jgi:hypothetical protein
MANCLAYEIFGDNDTLIIRNRDKMVASGDLNVLLDFLQFSGKHVIRTVFEIDEFAAPLLRKLSPESLNELLKTNSTNFGRFRIYYIPNIELQIGHTYDRFGTCYYGFKNFLNIPGMLPTPPLEQVQSIGQEILDSIEHMNLGTGSLKLTTPSAVFVHSDVGSKFMNSLPLGRDLPPAILADAIRLSALADDKYWVESRAVGKWDTGEIFDYDLSGAFSSIASKLYDIRDLTFWRSDKVEDNALYGVIKGRFYLDPTAEYAHASPIVVKSEAGDFMPLGWLPEDAYTLDEIRTVERYDIGKFYPTGQGIFAKTLSCTRPRFPYLERMSWLYDQREWSDMSATLSKVTANAIVGKQIEKREGAEYLNRFYHAIITAQTRCLITKFIVENEVRANEFLATQTDGVKLSKNISLRNGRLGSWRNNGTQPTIIHSGHRVYAGGKQPFKINYAEVEQMVAEHPNIERYGKKAPHRTTIQEALEAGDTRKVGELVNLPTYFDLVRYGSQQTRKFDILPRTGKELLNGKYYSRPLVLEE